MVNPDPSFWRGRRVLVTGHTGFKGAWLCLWLEKLGAEVAGYSLDPPSSPSLYELACADGPMSHFHGDIRDLDALCRLTGEFRPEIILHLAAQSLVRPSYDDPVGTYATNVMGTVNVLEAARRTGGVLACINVTSDKCYENRNWHWPYREDEPMGGHDPYSSSKGCSELVTTAYRRSFFDLTGDDGSKTALASARAGNVVAGGDWAKDRILPDCIRAFCQGEPVVLRCPEATRPWQHALDPLNGYLMLAERLARGPNRADFAQGWNFGPAAEDVITVGRVVETIAELWGPEATWRVSRTPQPHEATLLKVDASRARSLLSWKPKLSMRQTLEWTVEWYRRHAQGDFARDLCLEQIKRFEALGDAHE